MDTKDKILRYAVECSKRGQLTHFTRDQVAAGCECSEANVSYHFGTMGKLRLAVIAYAVEHEVIEILAQARANRDPALHGRLTPALKERVVAFMSR